jgi:glycosyltransferase involved in cell wall biosynthesis
MSSGDASSARRIALVTPGYPPQVGGVELHVAELARRLARRGAEVDVLTHATGEAPAGETADGVRIRRFPLLVRRQHYPVSGAMLRYLRSRVAAYDVVHAHNYHALPALMAASAKPRGFVFTPHYHGASASRFRDALHRVYRLPGRRIMQRAAAVICVSSAEAAKVRRDFPAVGDRVRVIPNGVDRTRLRDAEPFAGHDAIVLTVGRLEDYKRVDRAIAALAHLPGEELFVIGDGPARTNLEAQASRHDHGSRVTFLGRVPDDELRRWYKTAQAVVSLSEHEAFGLVPAEALAAGTPVVLSDIAAHRDIAELAGPSCCRLVSATDGPEAVAAAIASLSGTDGCAGGVPDWDEVVDRTSVVYDEVIAGSGA